MSNESAIESCQSMKTMNLRNCLGCWPLSDCSHLLLIYSNPICSNYKPKKYDAVSQEGTFLEVDIQLVLLWNFQHLLQMLKMIALLLTIDQDIVKIDDDKFSSERSQHLSHQPHEGTRCVG